MDRTWTAHLTSYRHDDAPTLVIRTESGSTAIGFYLSRAGMWKAIGHLAALATIGVRVVQGPDDLHRNCGEPECDQCVWRGRRHTWI